MLVMGLALLVMFVWKCPRANKVRSRILAAFSGKRANALREGFDPAFVAFKQAQDDAAQKKEYPDDRATAFRCIAQVYGEQPTEASVRHYTAMFKRDGLDEDQLRERVAHDRAVLVSSGRESGSLWE